MHGSRTLPSSVSATIPSATLLAAMQSLGFHLLVYRTIVFVTSVDHLRRHSTMPACVHSPTTWACVSSPSLHSGHRITSAYRSSVGSMRSCFTVRSPVFHRPKKILISATDHVSLRPPPIIRFTTSMSTPRASFLSPASSSRARMYSHRMSSLTLSVISLRTFPVTSSPCMLTLHLCLLSTTTRSRASSL